jgi:hypothetical protein
LSQVVHQPMSKYELPGEVYRGMVQTALIFSVPALVASNVGFLYADSAYAAIGVMLVAFSGIALVWYRRGYLNTDEWE